MIDDNEKSIEKKLGTNKYICSEKSHLAVNQDICKKCKEKVCTFICPAKVYNISDITGEIIIQYENCLECGACRISCPYGIIKWEYPSGGTGIIYKNN